MNELVERLATGQHQVAVGGPQPSCEDFKRRLEHIGYVFIKFTETRGGTDLGVKVDRQATHFDKADFVQGHGTVHVEGTLSLNYVPVRCVAEIDLSTLSGLGHLVVQQEIHA